MFKKNAKLIIGLGRESSLIVRNTKTDAEKFTMDFTKVYYPKEMDLRGYQNNYNLINEKDFWWCGEDIFENIKTSVFEKLLKNKKTVIIVVSKMGQKEAGFVNALIRYAGAKSITLILNKNWMEESLYEHFCRICDVVDTFYTTDFLEKFYDADFHIRPHTSILEMEACLNISFINRIKESVNRCITTIVSPQKESGCNRR